MFMERQTIDAWSFSRLDDYESCKLKAKLKYLDKIVIEQEQDPDVESARDRGSRIHTNLEHFVKNETTDFPVEAKKFETEIYRLQKLYNEGKVLIEENWAFTSKWEETQWQSPSAWLRMKLDAFVLMTEKHGVVIDYKTGKRWGQEIKHAEQARLYQLACFIKYPELEYIDVEFWYLDADHNEHTFFTKEYGLQLFNSFNTRGLMMTLETEFKANPNGHSCRFCPYKQTEYCPATNK